MTWTVVAKTHVPSRELADRHYSRQTPGATCFTPPGRSIVLARPGAVWAAVENLDPRGGRHWRVTIFRRESGPRASELVLEATAATYTAWRATYGVLPAVPLRTEVDPRRVRRKRDPGRCFLRAGWRFSHATRDGLIVFEAPKPEGT